MDVKTSVLLVDGKYSLVTLDYVIKDEEDNNQENGDDEPSAKKRRDGQSGQK